jgi:hypothetical protein
VDFLTPALLRFDLDAEKALRAYRGWGIDRFSVRWTLRGLPQVLDRLDRLGADVDVFGVPYLPAFLETILHEPASVTSDFNFPQWMRRDTDSVTEAGFAGLSCNRLPRSA